MHQEPARVERHTSRELSPTRERSIDHIQVTKAALDETIEQLNFKLHEHFQNKEQALLQQYKKELVEAQKELNELKSTTNEEQIKNKMLERKKELERERHQLIQTNIFFSSKCEEYKKKLADLVAEGKELQRELVFLDAQLQSTTKRKNQVLTQEDPKDSLHPPEIVPPTAVKQEFPSSLPVLSDRKSPGSATAKKLVNSISVKSTNKRMLIEDSLHSRVRKNLVRGEVPKSVFEKTVLEELFEATVAAVRERRKSKKNVHMLKGEEFSDYQKKMIMQDFLSKDEVKKKIYEIIFETEEKRPVGYSMLPQPKVKISYDDIS